MRRGSTIALSLGIGIPIMFLAGGAVMSQICAIPTPSQEWNNKLNALCNLYASLSQLIETAVHLVQNIRRFFTDRKPDDNYTEPTRQGKDHEWSKEGRYAYLKGCEIFHNCLRPHQGLEGKTPSEACGIKIEGDNKWITLIQNAKKNA